MDKSEFEKWWNNSVRIYIHNPKDKEILKCGYKVALEWAENQPRNEIIKELKKLED